MAELAKRLQEVTGGTVEMAFVDQGDTDAATQTSGSGIKLHVVKHTEEKKGFVLLTRRWVVERTFGLAGAFPTTITRLRASDDNAGAMALAGKHRHNAQTGVRVKR